MAQLRCRTPASVSLKGVARIKWQFAIHAEDFHRAANGIDIENSHRAGRGFHDAQQILVAAARMSPCCASLSERDLPNLDCAAYTGSQANYLAVMERG